MYLKQIITKDEETGSPIQLHLKIYNHFTDKIYTYIKHTKGKTDMATALSNRVQQKLHLTANKARWKSRQK